MNVLLNRVYNYGTCGLGQDAVNELLDILDKLPELKRLAEIGEAVERQLDKSFWMNKYDLENLMDWYREQSTK